MSPPMPPDGEPLSATVFENGSNARPLDSERSSLQSAKDSLKPRIARGLRRDLVVNPLSRRVRGYGEIATPVLNQTRPVVTPAIHEAVEPPRREFVVPTRQDVWKPSAGIVGVSHNRIQKERTPLLALEARRF